MINPAIENDLKNMSLNDVNYADYIKENYIKIPNNATNGEIFMAIYTDIWRVGTVLSDDTENIIATNVNIEWWNLPYKTDNKAIKEGD